MALPPAICSACGCDVARGATTCRDCLKEFAPWEELPRDGGRALPVGTLPLGLGLAITVGLVLWRRPPGDPPLAVPLTLAVGLGGVLLVLAMRGLERSWRAASGAMATTTFGWLTTAEGTSTTLVHHSAAAQTDMRGDVVYAALQGSPGPHRLGGNPLETALAATLVGAAARGTIELVEQRGYTWTRILRARHVKSSKTAGPLFVRPLRDAREEEDALAALLFPRLPERPSTSYREAPAEADARLPRRLVAMQMLDILPLEERPGRWVKRLLPKPTLSRADVVRVRTRLAEIVTNDKLLAPWEAARDAVREGLARSGEARRVKRQPASKAR